MHIDPVKALFWAAILNGLVAAPLMAVIMIMASSRGVMGKLVIPPYLKTMGWAATAVMFLASVGVFLTEVEIAKSDPSFWMQFVVSYFFFAALILAHRAF